MKTITEEYIKLNKQLHEQRSSYGTSSGKWVSLVQQLCVKYNTTSVLDYGCGKGLLQKNLPFEILQYDPAIEEHSARPTPRDIVVCTDVLEHIEPECLDAVLDDLKNLTNKVALLNVATRKAVKTLPDGRNAHLIVQPKSWWLPKIEERFNVIKTVQDIPNREFSVLATPL